MRCWIPGRHSVYPSGGFKGPLGSGSFAAAARWRLSPRVVLLSHVPSWLCCGWTPGLPEGLGAEPGGASAGRESCCWVSLFMFPGQEFGRAPAADKLDGSVMETTVTRAKTQRNRGSQPRRGHVLSSRPWKRRLGGGGARRVLVPQTLEASITDPSSTTVEAGEFC